MLSRINSIFLAITFALIVCVAPAVAQQVTGSITGTVTDSSGAVVPNANVVITNTATGVVAFRGQTAADSGVYRAPVLPVGVYEISVEAAGFKTQKVTAVTLQVDQRARIDIALQPGGVAETITVTGESAGLLESESSSVGAVINTSQVKDLPLPSRAVLNLLTLIPGVSSGGASTGIDSSQLSINGSRTLNSEFTVDGVSVVSGSTGGLTKLPSTEAIREFRVLTSGYSAEYGAYVRRLGQRGGFVGDERFSRYALRIFP